jgi:protease I
MNRIACIIDEDFEDSEYSEPAKAFKQAGHQMIHLGIHRGDMVRGKKKHTPVKLEQSVGEASPQDFDALFIPGGYSPDRLRAHPEAVNFVREFAKSGKPVFAICHAPQLLISAQVLNGRTVTGWKSIVQDIKNAGAKYVDQQVVEDGNFISSRQPEDIPAFVDSCLKKLQTAAHV